LGSQQDSLVLCKIFQKSGTGAKNEEASFGEEAAAGEVAIGDGETSELHHDQNFIDNPEANGMDANSFRVDDLYIEANDLSNPMEDEADFEIADAYLNFDFIEGFYPSEFLGTENASSHETPVTQKVKFYF
jgi:hypothetical protein